LVGGKNSGKFWWRNFLETELYGSQVGDGETALK